MFTLALSLARNSGGCDETGGGGEAQEGVRCLPSHITISDESLRVSVYKLEHRVMR